jgi:hypothetical protein
VSFLLDTDTCSAHLKQKGTVSNRFLQYTGGLHVSTITLAELYAWAKRRAAPPKRMDGLRLMLTDLKVLDVTAEVAEKYGQLQPEFVGHWPTGAGNGSNDRRHSARTRSDAGDSQHAGLQKHFGPADR